MSTNRDLFKEAIADAKAVKSMAIESAKAALEESFTPHLTKMFSAKLHELENEELQETESAETGEEENTELKENETTNEEINLDELLAELEGIEETESTDDVNEAKSAETGEEENAEESEENKTDKDEEAEEIKVEDMSEEDLKKFVEDVIKAMTASGEIEAGHEGAEEKEESESEEEEVNLEEVLAELGLNEKDEYVTDQTEEDDEPYSKEKAVKVSFKEELDEALATIKALKGEMNEVNLLNAKLLYTNKIFKAKNLTESVKVKVLNSFDKAKTVTESKLVYETILESLKDKKTTSSINENLGRASKATGISPINKNQPILEVNDTFLRMQKLAGL